MTRKSRAKSTQSKKDEYINRIKTHAEELTEDKHLAIGNLVFTPRQFKYACSILKGNSKRIAKNEAGYSQRTALRDIETEDVVAYIDSATQQRMILDITNEAWITKELFDIVVNDESNDDRKLKALALIAKISGALDKKSIEMQQGGTSELKEIVVLPNDPYRKIEATHKHEIIEVE